MFLPSFTCILMYTYTYPDPLNFMFNRFPFVLIVYAVVGYALYGSVLSYRHRAVMSLQDNFYVDHATRV